MNTHTFKSVALTAFAVILIPLLAFSQLPEATPIKIKTKWFTKISLSYDGFSSKSGKVKAQKTQESQKGNAYSQKSSQSFSFDWQGNDKRVSVNAVETKSYYSIDDIMVVKKSTEPDKINPFDEKSSYHHFVVNINEAEKSIAKMHISVSPPTDLFTLQEIKGWVELPSGKRLSVRKKKQATETLGEKLSPPINWTFFSEQTAVGIYYHHYKKPKLSLSESLTVEDQMCLSAFAGAIGVWVPRGYLAID